MLYMRISVICCGLAKHTCLLPSDLAFLSWIRRLGSTFFEWARNDANNQSKLARASVHVLKTLCYAPSRLKSMPVDLDLIKLHPWRIIKRSQIWAANMLFCSQSQIGGEISSECVCRAQSRLILSVWRVQLSASASLASQTPGQASSACDSTIGWASFLIDYRLWTRFLVDKSSKHAGIHAIRHLRSEGS